MTDDAAFVAIDLGAESGRVIIGNLHGDCVALEPVHRFANVPVRTPDGLHWDILRLYSEILHGLRLAAALRGDAIMGIGVDSWAVDYGLVDGTGRLLGTPYHYRDQRTDGIRDEVAKRIPATEQYARTGIAQLPFNTLYQLVAQRRAGNPILGIAQSLLMIPDLLHYWLSGIRSTEYTNASTTGALGTTGDWASDILTRLDLPVHIFQPPNSPGTILGELRREVRDLTGLHAARIILPATHDTASAVAAVPATAAVGGIAPSDSAGTGSRVPSGWSALGRARPIVGIGSVASAPRTTHAYISSGTWSLLGLELDHPILSEEARLAGFTNEGGVGGTSLKPAGRYRFLTNIMGLWLLQECRRSWARGGNEWDYSELIAAAEAIPSPGVVLAVDDPVFLHPHDMPGEITGYLQRTGQATVKDPVLITRIVLEGLALAYRQALNAAERLAGEQVDTIHVVGGGCRNALLCRLTADACRRTVLAGPVEATAMGNVLVQAMGLGLVRDSAEIHAISRRSTNVINYEPGDSIDWDQRLGRLRALQATGQEAISARGSS